ncbi:patatin-like phospholipase family protein [Shewanella abyssi]|uniref:patatin-like phospholipase family protein n=1 Tax=Shewanella abyssi TaxID=311789 RepID=UPI00200E105A|nr:patatin-like phospholipase family protein [Shewanella abyssi]MCL1048285.1 patatin-like phospholipase family protein [Shewanella abyssi]
MPLNQQLLFLLLSLLLISGCSTKPEYTPVPEHLINKVEPLGIPEIRAWGDVNDYVIGTYGETMLARQEAAGLLLNEDGYLKPANMLTLSGGGENGAFGAGILKAWSDSGARPDFSVVTGISTGAIISVFAFLGSDYDDQLTSFYTSTDAKDLYVKKSFLSAITSLSLFDTTQFESKVRDTINPELLAKTAEMYGQGRALLIGTTNLDVQRMAIWDMGYIASLGTPDSEKLFEDIVLASASIPGMFPAVLVNVEYEGERYQEIHVDGGVVRQIFLLPDEISITPALLPNPDRERNLFVIRNGEFKASYKQTELKLLSITGRSISTLLKYQGRSDVMRLYNKAREANMGFNMAYIDDDFEREGLSSDSFDKEYMQALFDYGYAKFQSGDLWKANLPGVDSKKLKLLKAAELPK